MTYSKDPWDERRFSPFASFRRGRTTSWEAAAPFLLILGGRGAAGAGNRACESDRWLARA